MVCTRCSHENVIEAVFCANCGSRLAAAAASAYSPPIDDAGRPGFAPQPPAEVAYAPSAVRISTCAAAVGFMLLWLFADRLLAILRAFGYVTIESFLALLSIAGGLALGLRLHRSAPQLRSGRLPSVVGLLLIGAGGWFGYDLFYYRESVVSTTLLSYGALGLGMVLLLHPEFWRNLPGLSGGGKAALVVAFFIGLLVSASFGWLIGGSGWATFIAIIIGLPVVLVHPVVSRPRQVGGP